MHLPRVLTLLRASALALLVPGFAAAQAQPVTVTVAPGAAGAALAPRFLGLSYEGRKVLFRRG